MLANINYKGRVLECVDHFKFSKWKPQQHLYRCQDYTIVIFRNGKCRIMGCKKPILCTQLPYNILIEKIQSITISYQMNKRINLYMLQKKLGLECSFEPEMFPALRYTKYNPLCVNIFSTGKIIILGIKNLNYHILVKDIVDDISSFL